MNRRFLAVTSSLILVCLLLGVGAACSVLASPTATPTITPSYPPTNTPTTTPTPTDTPTATPTPTMEFIIIGPTVTPGHADNRGPCLECHVIEELVLTTATPLP